MGGGLTRRDLLRHAAAAGTTGTVALGLSRLAVAKPARAAKGEPEAVPVPVPVYTDFRDVYRGRWTWERVARGTHTNTNCASSCAWNLYVKEGVVWREEQIGTYAASNETVPDFNPRGCNKGACTSDLMLGGSRVLHPLRRAGPRGSGRWVRISWDHALDEIADSLLDELEERGGKGAICEMGPNIGLGPNTAAPIRFFRQLGAPVTDSMAMIGDLAVGGTITLGTPHTDGSSDDWFRSDYLVLWAFNPIVTRIPDAHFVTEARYGGARVVAIAPDYTQSAIHADLWLAPQPGSDAALALAACQVILAEDLHDADYVREQTDLPFLVRKDTGRFLREADLVRRGSESRFGVLDENTNRVRWAPGSEGDDRHSLVEPGLRPALEVDLEVQLASGESVEVETVLQRLRRQLDASSTPEQAAQATGVSAPAIRRFARDFAGAKAALIVSQWGSCKNYHSDLAQRSQILLASLTGNLGKAGGGWRSGSLLGLDGFALFAMQEDLGIGGQLTALVRSKLSPKAAKQQYASGFVPSTVFHAVHGGLAELGQQPGYEDPALEGGSAPYLREAVEKGHFPIGPGPDEPPPGVVFSIFGSVLRHARGYPRLRERLFDPARLVVDVNFRMSETGRHADILLPAAGWYEKVGLKYIALFVPYLTLGDRAVPPRGEAKPEWEIFSLLAERVADGRARRRARAQARDRVDPVLAGRADRPPPPRPLVQRRRPLRTKRRGGRARVHPGSLERAGRLEHGRRLTRRSAPRGRHAHQEPGRLPRESRPVRVLRARAGRSAPRLRRAEEAVPHTHRAPAVLHRSPLVPVAGRGAPHAQAPAGDRRGLPAGSDRRPYALEHPRAVARREADAAPAARRAGRLPQPGRLRGARDRGPGLDRGPQRPRIVQGAREAERRDPARAGAHLPRLGAVPVPRRL
jgi:DMSO reductase family type II enzyme molybdopterin subunit